MTHKRRLVLACVLTLVLAILILPHGQEWERARFIPPKPKPTPVIQATKDTKEQKDANRKMAKAYARAGYGWTGEQWVCLRTLWTSESRFDSKADNPRSSAFGIAQLLKEKETEPALQILKGLRYISHRYGSPCRSLSFWKMKKASGNPWY
jgi:hypothetical protein